MIPSNKRRPIEAIDHTGKRHTFQSINQAAQASHISFGTIRKLLNSGRSAHARGDDHDWTFYTADKVVAPIAAARRPSAALLAGATPTALDAAILEWEGKLQTLKAARDILAAQGV